MFTALIQAPLRLAMKHANRECHHCPAMRVRAHSNARPVLTSPYPSPPAVALWGLPVTLGLAWVAWPALDDGFKHSVSSTPQRARP